MSRGVAVLDEGGVVGGRHWAVGRRDYGDGLLRTFRIGPFALEVGRRREAADLAVVRQAEGAAFLPLRIPEADPLPGAIVGDEPARTDPQRGPIGGGGRPARRRRRREQ